VNASLDDATGFRVLGARLDTIEHEGGLPGNRVFYLALPPSMFGPAVRQMAATGFVRPPDSSPFGRLIIEKPIGHDLESARAINDELAAAFAERQIYRIDHYLGKETVQNILVLRFANSIFEPLFNQKYVDHVQITVAEEEGVGTRAGYYEQAGALRDMVQNHMLQLLALVAMEPPHALDADVIRDELDVIDRCGRSGRGDRRAGRARAVSDRGDGETRGYREAAGVDAASRTEAFVALQVAIDNWRPGRRRSSSAPATAPQARQRISIHLSASSILFNTDPAAPRRRAIAVHSHQPNGGLR
jgi:glucose-6-phosphate 1-dehydrogenase